MNERIQGRASFSARNRSAGRFVWGFGLSAVLLLTGCDHADVRREMPRIASLPIVPKTAAASRTTGGAPAIVQPASQESQAESGMSRLRACRRVTVPIRSASAAPRDVITASTEDSPPAGSAQEPEVLPPPERLSAPELPSPNEPAAGALDLTLPSALAQGLAENPDLVTLRGQLPVNEAMVGVAETPIWNPFVQAQLLPRGKPFDSGTGPGTGVGKTNYYVWAMQRFEIAHQRRYRTESALAALNQVQWNIMQAELLYVAQTARLYFTALYQKELYDLAMTGAELSEHLLEVQRRRFEANLALARDVTTAEIAARQARRQAEVAKIAYDAALIPLRQQLNLPTSTPLVLTERLADLRWLPLYASGDPQDETALAAELAEGRPDVMAAQVGIRVAQANWSLARAAMIPDIQAGPIIDTSDAGTKFLGLRLQMDIPVWNTGAPLAHQRHMETCQQALTYEQLKIKAGLEAQTAIQQFELVREMAAKFEPVRVDAEAPELTEILRLFEAGQADILAVLATQNDLLQEQRTNLDVLNQLAQSAAGVIQATALPVERVVARRDELSRP